MKRNKPFSFTATYAAATNVAIVSDPGDGNRIRVEEVCVSFDGTGTIALRSGSGSGTLLYMFHGVAGSQGRSTVPGECDQSATLHLVTTGAINSSIMLRGRYVGE